MEGSAVVLRVACVPAGHPYCEHVRPLPGDPVDVVHLPDPPVPGRPAGTWWPPRVLDPDWLAEHAEDLDVVHVHFGMESLPPGGLEAALDVVRRRRLPLVYTVHDLTNPQLHDQARHRRDTELLVAAADRLITLTPGAAAAIAAMPAAGGQRPTVVAHPHVIPLDAPIPCGPFGPGDPVTVGVQLRDLRANVDGPGTARLLVEAIAALHQRGVPARGRVQLDDDVRDAAAADAVVAAVGGSSYVELSRGGRLDDASLHRSLAELDACLLPYRSGTHSGWLELCWDLGVPVLSADGHGHYAEQHPGLLGFAAGDAAGLANRIAALTEDLTATRRGRPALQARRRQERRTQRQEVAAAHRRVYEEAIAAVAAREGRGPGGSARLV